MNQNNNGIAELPQFNFKSLFLFLLFLIGLYLLLPKLIGLEQALRLLLTINKFYLFLALAAEITSFLSAAWLLGIILSRLGYKLPFSTRFKLGSIAAFTIHFVPIGAAGQGAFDYYFLRKQKVEAGSIILLWILRLVFSYSAFLLTFLVGLALVQTYPHLAILPKITAVIIFFLILFGAVYLIHLYRHQNKFRLLWLKLFGWANAILSRFKQKSVAQEKQLEIFEDIYQGIGLFGHQKRTSVFALIAALIYWLGDITCFYFVFLAFGYSIGWGVLLYGYGVATLLGIISFIPGGMGVTEGSMALLYTSLGVANPLALMAILVFRLFSFWIWIPIGFFSFLSLRKSKG